MLDLSHLFITDDIAKRFLVLSELTELNVSHCRDLTNTGALGILRACPKMQTLVVTGCPLSTLGMLRLHRTRRNLQTWAITDVCWWRASGFCCSCSYLLLLLLLLLRKTTCL